MDSDQQAKLAQQQNPELAARVIRNIAAIEHDNIYAGGPLSERLLRDIAGVMRAAAPEPWTVVSTEWNVALNSPDWRATRGVGQDAHFELADMLEDEDDHSWAAVIVSAGPTKLCLELKFRKGLAPAAESLSVKDKPLANVLKEGFEQTADGTRLLIPIMIEAEALARGLELNDLDAVWTPLRRAVEIAITAKPDLDVLIEHVRKKGK